MMNVSTSGKSRLQDKLDKWFWWIIGFLPVIFWLFINVGASFTSERTFLYLDTVLTDYFYVDFAFAPVSVVADTISAIFGEDGIFPFFKADSALILYMVYFVYVQILHVLIDVLVFIPRFAHKILSKAINFGE